MRTTDQVIDEILLKSPYGAKAYEARHKRLIEKEEVEVVEDEITDHPQQTYLNFEENNHE
jgi:hypothetical protein